MRMRALMVGAAGLAALGAVACGGEEDEPSPASVATTTATATAVATATPTGTATASAATGTSTPKATATATSTAASTATPAATATASAVQKVNANTATIAQIQAALEAAGVSNASRWAREVEEYRPYPADPTWAKLRQELAKYNPGPGVVDQIISVLEQ